MYSAIHIKRPCNICKHAKPLNQFREAGRPGKKIRIRMCNKCRQATRKDKWEPKDSLATKRKRINAIYMAKWNEKICNACNVMQSADDFHKSQSYCKTCSHTFALEKRAEINSTCEGIAYGKYAGCAPGNNNRSRSRKEFLTNEEWNKTFDDHVKEHDYKCAATGMAFDVNDPLLRPSPDQIIPSGGYSKDNIRWTTVQYNISRQDYTDKQMFDMAIALCRANGCVVYESIEY